MTETSTDRHTAPNRILYAGEKIYESDSTHSVDPGQNIVVIHAQGKYRLARVVKVGPKRTTVAYGTSGTPYREKAVPHGCVYLTDPPDSTTYSGDRNPRDPWQVWQSVVNPGQWLRDPNTGEERH